MAAIITDQIRLLNAKNFVAGVTSTTNAYYSFIGLPNPTDIQTGNYFGSYSWGKILLPSRSEENTYEAYTLGGTGGISTSPVVRRSRSLKHKAYYTPPT